MWLLWFILISSKQILKETNSTRLMTEEQIVQECDATEV